MYMTYHYLAAAVVLEAWIGAAVEAAAVVLEARIGAVVVVTALLVIDP